MTLPPEQDLKVLIAEEHRTAELERLRAGYPGCGCAECQAFYHTIDLAKYGDRVKEYAGTVCILEGRAGADLWDKYNPPDSWSPGNLIFYSGGYAYGVDVDGRNICIGQERGVRAVIADPELYYNIPAFDRNIDLERKLSGIKREDITDARIRTRTNAAGAAHKRGAGKKGSRRGRPVLHVRHRAPVSRRTAQKGTARRLSKSKQPRLFA